MIFKLARKSLLNRRLTTGLTILSIALSMMLFLSVERVRVGAKMSFANTISKTDLIVGARSGPLQLLLFSVFQIGNATNNVSRESWDHFANHPDVKWTIPYSLGDSHRGFRVIGTNQSFPQYYRYQNQQNIALSEGTWPEDIFGVAIGASVAEKLNYKIGMEITLAHGIVEDGQAIQQHDDKPFRIAAIIKRTGTPIDRSIYTSLEGIEALHLDWQDGAAPIPGEEITAAAIKKMSIEVKQITAFFLGTKSRLQTLMLQREINDYQNEALMAIIPGVTLSQLWDGIANGEVALLIISFFVVIIGLFGMLISIYNSLNERRREMAILRSVGAGPLAIFTLLWSEAATLTFLGSLLGVGLMFIGFFFLSPIIASEFGLSLPAHSLTLTELCYFGLVQVLGWLMGLVPAWRAYRHALSDGLTIKT